MTLRDAVRLLGVLCAVCVPGLLNAHTVVSPTKTSFAVSPQPEAPYRGVITMTASVSTTAGVAVQTGLVLFCNALRPRCFQGTEIGRAQLTAAGTATYKTRLGIGAHTITAVFVGTQAHKGSTSSAETITVASGGPVPTSNTLSSTFEPDGTTALTATVTNEGASAATGTVSFLNQSVTPNSKVGAAKLSNPTYNFPVSGDPSTAVTADLNQDGIPDLLTITFSSTGQHWLQTALGNPDGSLQQGFLQFETEAACIQQSLGVGDFNGDGIPDVVAIDCSSNKADIYLGDGTGTLHFKSAISLNVPLDNGSVIAATSVTVGDFNGDGIPDIAVSEVLYPITILLGNGDGTFAMAPRGSGNTFKGYFVNAADFNGDGFADLAVTRYDITLLGGGAFDLAVPSHLDIYLSNGDGTFTQSATYGPYTVAAPPAFGDFDDDGITDIALPHWPGTGVFRGKGDGTFAETEIDTGAYSAWVSVGDFNGDGFTDLLVLDGTKSALLFGNGAGEFSNVNATGLGPYVADSYPLPTDLASVADWDGFGMSEPAPGVTLSISSTASIGGIVVPTDSNVGAAYSGDATHVGSVSGAQFIGGTPINLPGGFGGAAGQLQVNGPAAITGSGASGSVLRLTDGGQNEASSAFFKKVVTVSPFNGFWCDFDFRLTGKSTLAPDGEGFAFVMQDAGLTALGSPGAGLGYGSAGGATPGPAIGNSVAVKFDLYNNAGEGTSSTGVFVDGATPTVPAINLLPSGIDLHSGHIFHVVVTVYDDEVGDADFWQVSVTITDTVTKASFSNSVLLGYEQDPFYGGDFYVGFTGSTGTATAVQDILNFRLNGETQ